MIEIGWCGGVALGARARAVGYDFLEVPLAPLELENDASFKAATSTLSRSELPTPVFNRFLPQGMMVVGPDVEPLRIRRYLPRVAELAHAAGGKIVVFGGGWARLIPEGWTRERAVEQFLELMSWCADAFEGSGVTLAIESQNHRETNFITTVAEAVELARRVNRPEVRVITDIYHLYEEPEAFDVVTTSAEWLVHVHLSDSERKTPGAGTYDFTPLFDRLQAVDYKGRLSIECFSEVPEHEMRQTLEFVRERWDRQPQVSRTRATA